ncbi:hypothetical protein CsatB_015835 [Cannabis sativa]
MAPRKSNNITPKSSNQVSSTYSCSSNKGRVMKDSTQLHSATKSIVKSDKGKATTSFKKSFTADEFVDKTTGRLGFKEEASFTRTDKYNNKNDGFAHEFETQVKFKHVAYPNDNKPSTTTKADNNNYQITYYDDYYYC